MKKELLISKMAILLFFSVVLFAAPANAQLCLVMTSKSQCQAVSGCYWCGTTGYCNPYPTCPTCAEMDIDWCHVSYGCKYCDKRYVCIPKENNCPTCGDNIVQHFWEDCDGGLNCTANCACPSGV